MVARFIASGWRQLLLLLALVSFSSMIARNLFYWQVTEHAHIAHEAAKIYDSETNIPARRGEIFDTNGVPLVTDVAAFDVAVDPVDTPSSVKKYNAYWLGRTLRRDPGPILAQLDLPNIRYVVIARGIGQTAEQAVKALGLEGVIITPSFRAFYPETIAAPVLGFVSAANGGEGQYGLEQQYDSVLRGQDGSKFIYYDTANHPLPVGVQKPRPPVNGGDLILTLDSRIQAVVEQRLAAAIARYGAQSGTAIVMDPHTGAILAMASLPSFDPNHYGAVTNPAVFVNQALQRYQPGSTFKVFGISAGLDAGAFTPNTTVYDPGYYQNYGITVHNWEPTGWGVETPAIMLRHSANVGMAQFANMMGAGTFYKYVIDRFGFNSPTGVGLPDESGGYVRTPTDDPLWQMEDLLTNSYGQGIDATPLQVVTAFAALANDGWRMRPYIVKSIIYPQQMHRANFIARPQRVARAVSARTAATLRSVITDASDTDTAETTCALTKNYPVIAKTGTATIEGPSAHGMDLTGGTTASLLGYAPADDPKFVMLVTLRDPAPGPSGQDIYGAVAAAPAWHDIAESLYRIMGIMPQIGSTPPKIDFWQGPMDWNCGFMSH